MRWVLMFGFVALGHALLVTLLSRVEAPTEPAGEPALLVDMAPVEPAEAPRPPDEPPPEPVVSSPVNPLVTRTSPADAAPPQPEPATAAEPPAAQPPLEPDPPPEIVPEQPPTQPPPDPAAPDPAAPDPPVPVPQVIKPQAAAPRPKQAVPYPRPLPPTAAPRLEPMAAAARPTASPPPAMATAAASPSPPASWQARLLAHLNRFKRYPAEAQMRHRQGTALVHLRLLPNGSADAVRLQSSSGTSALDDEAVALIARAQPLPVPDAASTTIEIAVPILFTIR